MGELTRRSFQRVLDALSIHFGMTASSSIFADLGCVCAGPTRRGLRADLLPAAPPLHSSGCGKPVLHAAASGSCSVSVGVEIDMARHRMSVVALSSLLTEKPVGPRQPARAWLADPDLTRCVALCAARLLDRRVVFLQRDIHTLTSLEPATHVNIFDTVFPPALVKHVVLLLERSASVRAFVSYRPHLLNRYSLPSFRLVGKVRVRMHGSGEGKTAFFFQRRSQPPVAAAAATTVPAGSASGDEGAADTIAANVARVRGLTSAEYVRLANAEVEALLAAKAARKRTPHFEPFMILH